MRERSRVCPMSPSSGFAAAAEYGPARGTDGVEARALCGSGWFLLGVLLLPCLFGGAAHAQSPSLMDEIVKTAGFSESEVRAIGSEPLARELEVADPSTQAAFGGIIRLSSDGSGLADGVDDDRPGAAGIGHPQPWPVPRARATPATWPHFSPPIRTWRCSPRCKLNQCKFKLDRNGLEVLDAIDWNREDAGEHSRLAFGAGCWTTWERYRKQATAHCCCMRTSRSRFPGERPGIDHRGFTSFRRQAPGFTNYLLTYPEGRQAGMSDSIGLGESGLRLSADDRDRSPRRRHARRSIPAQRLSSPTRRSSQPLPRRPGSDGCRTGR